MTSVAGVAALVVTGGALWACWHAVRRRSRPGAVSFAAFSLCLVALTGQLAVSEFTGRVSPLLINTLVLSTVLWTGFVFDYTGRGPAMTRRRLAGLTAFGVLVSVSQWVLLARLDAGSPYTTLVSLSNLGVIAFGAFGVFLVVRAGVTYDDLERDRALVLTGVGTALVTTWFVGTVFNEQLDLAVGRVLLLGQAGIVVGLSVLAQSRYDLLEASPSAGYLARDRVFDEMTEAVLVANDRGRLLDTNAAAERVFGLDADVTLGAPVADAVGRGLSSTDGTVVSLEARTGQREFRVRASPLGDADDSGAEGTVYLLRDVTDRRTREQQIQVLNRVLRHNLRNDLDSIRGLSEPIRDGNVTASEASDLGERIGTGARRVLSLGEKIARAEHLLDERADGRERVPVTTVVERAVTAVTERHPTADVECTLPEDDPGWTDGAVLRMVLRELLDNAVTHGDTARVTVTRRTGTLSIAVADDGPGIPEQERAALLDGEETQLRHGSGVGLWIVNWGVRELGGTVSLDERETDGSVVTVTLPVAAEAAPTDAGRDGHGSTRDDE